MQSELLSNPFVIKGLFSLGIFITLFGIQLSLTSIINKRPIKLQQKYNFRKMVHYIVIFTIIIVMFLLWIPDKKTIGTILAICGAGIIIAMQDSILSFIGWLLIMIEGLYEPGNRIEIAGHKGDVIDIAVFYTTLVEIGNWVEEDQSTGRITKIPNNLVLKNPVYNYNKGFPFVWNEIKVMITFESDWEKAKKIMLELTKKYADQIEDMEKAIQKLSHKYLIYFSKLTPIVYSKIKESGVELSLRYLSVCKKRRSTGSELQENILTKFGQESDIDFAYPTIRYYTK